MASVDDYTDLVGWLREQLDIDERLARGCVEEVGSTKAGEMYPDGSGPCEQDDYPSYPYGSGARELAFQSVFDPARVLREVRAKQRLLREIAAVVDVHDRGLPEDEREAPVLLKLLAMPYADRPGFREEWKGAGR